MQTSELLESRLDKKLGFTQSVEKAPSTNGEHVRQFQNTRKKTMMITPTEVWRILFGDFFLVKST